MSGHGINDVVHAFSAISAIRNRSSFRIRKIQSAGNSAEIKASQRIRYFPSFSGVAMFWFDGAALKPFQASTHHSFLIHDEQVGSCSSVRLVNLRIVSDLVTHPRGEREFFAILLGDLQPTLQAKQNMPLTTPVIG
jgi:hypothetical protein